MMTQLYIDRRFVLGNNPIRSTTIENHESSEELGARLRGGMGMRDAECPKRRCLYFSRLR